jgi:hypothetical protein
LVTLRGYAIREKVGDDEKDEQQSDVLDGC